MIYLDLFFTFFRIGLFTFGGGYAMLPLIQEAVLAKGWIENTQLINFVAVSESTPGPFAINISTYIGAEMSGILGAACATLGVVLPSFIIILIVAKYYEKFKTNKIVKGCMNGLKPAVVGLIASAVLSMAKTVFLAEGLKIDFLLVMSAIIFLVMLVLALKKKHPIMLILISAVAGIAVCYINEFMF